MCGITGFISTTPALNQSNTRKVIVDMMQKLVHRGPDSSGVWISDDSSVALGHRRLAIRDLSPLGHQPMVSSCGKYVLIYNGEVYSHQRLINELEAAGFQVKGTSDTRAILEHIAHFGLHNTLPKLVGMFAFSLYDIRRNKLILVRDRVGIKPLYWGKFHNSFFFASELKALLHFPGWPKRLDKQSLASYLRYSYIPAPHTIYQGIYKLEPGRLLEIDSKTCDLTKSTYWDMLDVVNNGLLVRQDAIPCEDKLIDELEDLIGTVVQDRLISDVPIGCLLSGGVDSSLVASFMADRSSRQVSSFSIGFDSSDYDESPSATAVAKSLGTDHTELYVSGSLALDFINKIPDIFDEPFADSSQLPTSLVCELTKNYVDVVLTGDGGDEVFAGYTRYGLASDLFTRKNFIPHRGRKFGSNLIRNLPAGIISLFLGTLPGSFNKLRQLDSKLKKFADILEIDEPDDMYRRLVSQWNTPESIVLGSREHKSPAFDTELCQSISEFLDRMQFLDSISYLPDDILTKVDRASMHYSLETRVPLLDHRLIEFAWQLPQNFKYRGNSAKWCLKQILYKRIPKHLVDRPKMGFGIPINEWLRGPLRGWAENLLDEPTLRRQQIFNVEAIHSKWDRHLRGENFGHSLWNILVFQQWLSRNPDITL